MPDPIQATKPAEFAPAPDDALLPDAANVDAAIKALAESQPAVPQPSVGSVESVVATESATPAESGEGISVAPESGAEFEIPQEAGVPVKKQEGFIDEAITALRQRLRKTRKPTAVPIVRDKLAIEVEHVMEEGLKEAYRELSPIEREEFKIKGEETASAIRALLRQTHVRVKKIFFLILEWLKLLPGVNRFFLEQEAKIKTDKILALKEIYEKRIH